MQNRESSEWWKWLAGALVAIALLYLARGGPEGSGKQPAPPVSPALSPTSSLPDYCWHTPDGIECDEPSCDERWADVPDEALYGAEMEEAVREATIEALIEEAWEAERLNWRGELRSLKARIAESKLDVSDEVLSDALAQMRDDLTTGEVADRRAVLRRFVHRIEAQRERATLWYTFPLAMGPLYECPQGSSI